MSISRMVTDCELDWMYTEQAKCMLGAGLALMLTACAHSSSGDVQEPASPGADVAGSAASTSAQGASAAAATSGTAISVLDPAGVRYSDFALLPRPITSFGAALHRGSLYVLGGYSGQPHDYSRDGQSGSLWRLPLAGGSSGATQWDDLAGIEPLQSVALVAHDDALVRIGGMRATNASGEPSRMLSIDEVAMFRPGVGDGNGGGDWQPLPPLPAPRSSHDAVVLDGVLYVVGGWQLTGEDGDNQWHSAGLAYDLRAGDGGSWKSFAAPFQRRALALVAVSGKLVAIGGMNSQGRVSARVDIYDPATGTWARGPDYPASPFGIAATADGDWVYASGVDGGLYGLDMAEMRWARVGALTFPRFFHRLHAADGQVWAVGGIASMRERSRVRAIERIDIAADKRMPRVQRLTVAAPGPAKNRQGIFVHEHALYAFGGNRSLGQHDFEPEHFLSEGHILHLGSLTWSSMAKYPMKRQTMQTIVSGDGALGISVGGFGYDHDGAVARTFPEIFAYSFEDDAWQPQAGALAVPRSQFGLARHNGHLWVFGGLDYDPRRKDGDHFRHLLPVLKAPMAEAPIAMKEAGVSLPQARRAFGGAVLEGRYYLVGGMRENFQMVDGCDVYDFASETWAQIPAPQRTRLSPQVVALGGKLYLAGGSSRPASGEKLAPDGSIEVFDPKTQRWSVLIDKLPMVTKHMRVAAYGERLLIYSAHSESDEVHLMLVDVGAETQHK